MSEFVGPAFFGALFAFLFMWIWDAIVRFNNRWDRHYSGVVRLGRVTNEQLAGISNAIYEIDEILNAYREAEAEPGIIPMSANQPEAILIDSSFELDIVNLDLINDFASYRYNLRCINRDIQRLSELKSNLEQAFSGGQLSPEGYLANLKQLGLGLGKLRNHLAATLEEAITLTAKARVRMKRDTPRFHGLAMKLRNTKYEKNFADDVRQERPILVGEIKAGSAKSGERIEAIHDGTYKEET